MNSKDKIVQPINYKNKGLNGEVEIPADKSISHRAAMFSTLVHNNEPIKIYNFSKGKDCHSTLGVLKDLGVKIEFQTEQELTITSPEKFTMPEKTLDAGNSGTTIRLMSGILAGQEFDCSITGDESLQKRPMKRVITPLEQMGAQINSNDGKAPLEFKGQQLKAIDYKSPIASAQVKSCVLLAGLHAEGTTTVEEPHVSRNHTEIMLKHLGANISVDGTKVSIQKSKLEPKELHIPGDISSAAFFIAAGLIVPNSEIILKNVGLNETRTGVIDLFKQMGGSIEILNERTACGEKAGDIKVKSSQLKGTTIKGDIIPRLIDEIPVIAVVAAMAKGVTTIKDAEDLRNKEADRITCVANELRKFGVKITETKDGMIIKGKTTNAQRELVCSEPIKVYHDHRIAMAMYIASLVSAEPVTIEEFSWVDISFPEFDDLFKKLI